ncbi:hypothetical protein HNP84_005055 [Thermocatellispora tengchongensis]|uniref:CopC domain-containing protein n=1 Tax=Thermocatellispora tengchongensis TaxID=1073253 RepID=A0A840P8J9_9ACTN|nr:copper resistance protein CopC [Thermocatellispora tengchongensis]MBB5135319.1 hypothetical protein [Thermocatellispora tengchongensis]
MRRLLTVLALVSAALAFAAPAALAHNVLTGSDPKDGATLAEAPERVTLTFDQPVRRGFTQLTVTGPDGARYEQGAPEVDGPDVTARVAPLGPAGEYVIGYRILSSDGHPVTGKLTFTLTKAGGGGPSVAPTPAPAASDGASDAAADAASDDAASDGAASDRAADAERRELSAQAAEASQNGGAGMAVLWIAVALVLLAGATVVAMRRNAAPAQGSATAQGSTTTQGSTTVDDSATVQDTATPAGKE